MKKFILFLLLSVMIPGLYAKDSVLFTYQENEGVKQSQSFQSPGDYRITPAENLFLMPVGTESRLDLKGIFSYTVIHDRKVTHANGSVSWFGYLKEFGKGYRISLIQGKDSLQGTLMTPKGTYKIETRDKQQYLIDLEEKGIQDAGTGPEDYKISRPARQGYRVSQDRVPSVKDNLVTTIDLMILYLLHVLFFKSFFSDKTIC